MADIETKTPAKVAEMAAAEKPTTAAIRRPFESLRREVDRLFEDFDRGFWRLPSRSLLDIEPFWRRGAMAPAVDIIEQEKDYQLTVELPGMEEKDVELKVANDVMTIKGEKKEEKEEKQKDYYLSERHYGAFQRSFALPASTDAEKIEASFKKGVLTVTLPKKPEAITPERNIEVKAG
jgi:HSP20 family protein